MEPVAAFLADGPGIKDLLSSCGLPHEDIAQEHLRHFWVLKKETKVIGVVGLEPFASSGLLRSLAVDPRYQHRSLGSRLARHAEEYARSLKLQKLYLLTTTAEGFFAKRGYERVPRGVVPEQIQRTAQFRSLCPVTAVCMVKSL